MSTYSTISPNSPASGLGSTRSSRPWLLIILGLGLVLRVGISFFSSLPWMHKDSFDYFDQADTLLQGGYTNFFPNGYPFVIALCKKLAGTHAETLLVLLNILMSMLVIYFVYVITSRVFKNERVGLIAALIVTVFPSQINYTRWLTTETPTAFFLVGAYYFYILKKNTWSGLFFGLATITRTEILPIALLVVLVELIARKRFNGWLFVATLIPVLLIGAYCYNKTGEFSISGHGRVNILTSITASGGYLDWEYDDQHPEINTSGKAVQLYMDHLRADPGTFIKNRFMNLWELWGYPSDAQGSRGTATRMVIAAGNLFLLLFGCITWWQNRKYLHIWMLLFPFIVITGVHIVLFAMQRYTYPVEPFMIVLAAWSVNKLISRRTSNA